MHPSLFLRLFLSLSFSSSDKAYKARKLRVLRDWQWSGLCYLLGIAEVEPEPTSVLTDRLRP
jgi:hypothetical protein